MTQCTPHEQRFFRDLPEDLTSDGWSLRQCHIARHLDGDQFDVSYENTGLEEPWRYINLKDKSAEAIMQAGIESMRGRHHLLPHTIADIEAAQKRLPSHVVDAGWYVTNVQRWPASGVFRVFLTNDQIPEDHEWKRIVGESARFDQAIKSAGVAAANTVVPT